MELEKKDNNPMIIKYQNAKHICNLLANKNKKFLELS